MLRKTLVALSLLITIITSAQSEVVYHINQQSFFDTDNNGTGDLKGVEQKLDYINRLGAGAIWLSPVYPSDFYDNQYASNFQAVNPAQGSLGDYKTVVQGAHKRKMKVYLEMNFNYVSPKHTWVTDRAKYKNYLLEELQSVKTTAGENADAVMVNLKEQKVTEGIIKSLKFWINPDNNTNFYSGADGFVFHTQDTLGKQTDLLKTFWKPFITEIKKIKPEIKIIAKPQHASYKEDEYYNAGFDIVVSNKMKEAIASFNKTKIEEAANGLLAGIPEGKNQMVFVQSEKDTLTSIQKAKAQAVLNTMLGGTPAIYNGQEAGLTQQSMDWQKVNAQVKNKSSLWGFYRVLLFNRNTLPALSSGTFSMVENSGQEVISFVRENESGKAVVLVNLSNKHQTITLDPEVTLRLNNLKQVMGTAENNFMKGGRRVVLEPYGVQIWKL